MLLLSRFWYFALAVAAMTAFGAAVLAQTSFNRQYDSDLSDQLRRDRLELELLLKTEARTRLDDIAPIAAHSEVRSALRSSSSRRGEPVDAGTRTALTRKLSELNRQLNEVQGELLFAVNDTGVIVAQIGAGDVPNGASLAAFPLVDRALRGYQRDDVWVWNGKVYRMAARPVIDGGGYAGAIVHGKLINDRLADRLASLLHGASVAFFSRDQIIASHMPAIENAPPAAEIAKKLPTVLTDPKFAQERRTEPLALEQDAKAVFSLVTGSAGNTQVGYAIARPAAPLTSAFQIFERASSDDVSALPWGLLVFGALFLFGLGMLFLWLERDRPLLKLRDAMQAVRQRKIDRLNLAEFHSAYRRLAEDINVTLDVGGERRAESASKKRSADLDQILGPVPGEASAQPYFGFASKNGSPNDVPEAPGAGVRPKHAAGTPMKGPISTDSVVTPVPVPDAPAPGAIAAKQQPAPPGPRAPGVRSKPGWARSTLLGTGGDPGSGSGPIQASAHEHAVGAGLASFDPGGFEEEDGVTMVAQVPEELLASIGPASPAKNGDEQHFRQVYEQFVAMKRECSESTAGLNYEKFAGTLRKNRDQILSKHEAKTVRFTVYVKEGKAALKATPIR